MDGEFDGTIAAGTPGADLENSLVGQRKTIFEGGVLGGGEGRERRLVVLGRLGEVWRWERQTSK
jgi:hypothetical protein